MQKFEPQDPAWETRVRTSFTQQSLMATLNADCSIWRRDDARFVLRSARVWASNTASSVPELLQPSVTARAAMPARGRELVATAEVIRKGRRLSVCLARIETDPGTAGGRLCAIMLATVAVAHMDRRAETAWGALT